MKERIKNVLDYKKSVFWIVCILIITCIVVTICFLIYLNKDRSSSDIVFGTYVKNDSAQDSMLNSSGLTINEDGTFTYSPNILSSYMGYGTWAIDGDYIIFSDMGLEDVRREVFQYLDGKLYYVTDKSASNSMWGLVDGMEFVTGKMEMGKCY